MDKEAGMREQNDLRIEKIQLTLRQLRNYPHMDASLKDKLLAEVADIQTHHPKDASMLLAKLNIPITLFFRIGVDECRGLLFELIDLGLNATWTFCSFDQYTKEEFPSPYVALKRAAMGDHVHNSETYKDMAIDDFLIVVVEAFVQRNIVSLEELRQWLECRFNSSMVTQDCVEKSLDFVDDTIKYQQQIKQVLKDVGAVYYAYFASRLGQKKSSKAETVLADLPIELFETVMIQQSLATVGFRDLQAFKRYVQSQNLISSQTRLEIETPPTAVGCKM